jgi:hypothetical protein
MPTAKASHRRGGLRGVCFAREPIADEQGERGHRGQDVVLLAGGEAEEEHGHGGPDEEQETGAIGIIEFCLAPPAAQGNAAQC